VVVYGVKILGYDGQLGAAAITLIDDSPAKQAVYMAEANKHLRSRGLPAYATPRLVRFTKQIAIGTTFKHAKDVYKKRSWNPDPEKHVDTMDTMYWLNGDTYQRLDDLSWSNIETAKAKL